MANSTDGQIWTYDAAGNGTSDYTGSGWTYDNLNRMTASPNTTYTNDILGNRTATTKTIQSGGGVTGTQSGSMTWDCLNRMVSATAPGALAHTNYEYRADGMRVQKSYYRGTIASEPLGGPASAGGLATSSAISATASAGAPVATTSSPAQTTGVGDVLTTYRYDGQMPMETYAAHDDGSSVLTDHGLGARGVDYVQIQSLSTSGQLTTSIDYPIYDAHGNEVATLSRSGTNSYALNNQRSYGAWGEIRQGAATGGPRGRYCGALGHLQDDETGLIYMRARYYESSSGRFISEDPIRSGWNWYYYCDNSPSNGSDVTGKSFLPDWNMNSSLRNAICCAMGIVAAAYVGASIAFVVTARCKPGLLLGAAVACAEAAVALAALSFAGNTLGPTMGLLDGVVGIALEAALAWAKPILGTAASGAFFGTSTLAFAAIAAAYTYTIVLVGEMVSEAVQDATTP